MSDHKNERTHACFLGAPFCVQVQGLTQDLAALAATNATLERAMTNLHLQNSVLRQQVEGIVPNHQQQKQQKQQQQQQQQQQIPSSHASVPTTPAPAGSTAATAHRTAATPRTPLAQNAAAKAGSVPTSTSTAALTTPSLLHQRATLGMHAGMSPVTPRRTSSYVGSPGFAPHAQSPMQTHSLPSVC